MHLTVEISYHSRSTTSRPCSAIKHLNEGKASCGVQSFIQITKAEESRDQHSKTKSTVQNHGDDHRARNDSCCTFNLLRYSFKTTMSAAALLSNNTSRDDHTHMSGSIDSNERKHSADSSDKKRNTIRWPASLVDESLEDVVDCSLWCKVDQRYQHSKETNKMHHQYHGLNLR